MSRIRSSLAEGQHQFVERKRNEKQSKPAPRSSRLKRTPLKKQSKKRAAESKIYSAKRKAFLEAHPMCERSHCYRRAVHVHHKLLRGKHYLDESSYAALCSDCHAWVHQHPKDARLLGLLPVVGKIIKNKH